MLADLEDQQSETLLQMFLKQDNRHGMRKPSCDYHSVEKLTKSLADTTEYFCLHVMLLHHSLKSSDVCSNKLVDFDTTLEEMERGNSSNITLLSNVL